MHVDNEADRRQQEHFIVQAQRSLIQSFYRASAPVWLHLDLTMGQLKALFALANGDAMTVSQLGRSLGLGAPAASILVERLVQSGLVNRSDDPDDRRRTWVRLSGSGSEIVAQLRQGGRGLLEEWLGAMSAADLDALARGMRGLMQVIEQSAAPNTVSPIS